MSVAATTGAPKASHIPNGWHHVRLGEVAEVVGGSTPSRTRPEYWGGDIPWVVPSELTELAGRYLQDSRESITVDGLESTRLRILPVGSVLLTTRATIGLAAINTLPITTNQGFQSLVGKNGTDSLWLYYCISSKRRELEQRGAGSTFREVSRDGVRTLPILLPPLSEQRAIAAVLDSIDEAIERADEVVAATENLRDALLHELLTRGLPGQHSEWKEVPGLGTIPASWKAMRLGDVVDINRDSWLPRDEEEIIHYLDLTAVFAPGSVADPREIVSAEAPSRARRRVHLGDVLVSTVRPNLRGFARITGTRNNLIASTGFAVLSARQSTTSSYIYHHVMTPCFAAYLENATTGQAYPAVRPADVAAYKFGLPSLPEQRAIAAVLDSVDAAIERTREERCDLRSLQASTADALLTGRVRVDQRK